MSELNKNLRVFCIYHICLVSNYRDSIFLFQTIQGTVLKLVQFWLAHFENFVRNPCDTDAPNMEYICQMGEYTQTTAHLTKIFILGSSISYQFMMKF